MKTEITLFSTFLIGLIFKFAHLPGANMLILFSLVFLGILYFPFAFYFFCDKKIKNQNLVFSICSGILLAFIPIGIAFKLLYWPGASLYLLIGLLTAPCLLIITFIQKRKAEHLFNYYKNMLYRTTTLTILTTFFFFLSTQTLVNLQYGNDPELARLKYLHYSNPENQQYVEELEAYQLKKENELFREESKNQ